MRELVEQLRDGRGAGEPTLPRCHLPGDAGAVVGAIAEPARAIEAVQRRLDDDGRTWAETLDAWEQAATAADRGGRG